MNNKKNKFIQGGCDDCGELTDVRKVKSGKQGNFMHVYLCAICMPVKE